jgi:hypothetical protein
MTTQEENKNRMIGRPNTVIIATNNKYLENRKLKHYKSSFLIDAAKLTVGTKLIRSATNRNVAGSIPEGVTGIFH